MKKILVATHTSRYVENETIQSVFDLRGDFDFRIFSSWGADEGKNAIARYAIEQGYEKVLFIDSDCVLNPDTLEKLLSRDKHFIVAWTLRRQNTTLANIFGLDEKPIARSDAEAFANSDQPVRQVWTGGTHCLLADVATLKRIARPWFKFAYDANGNISISEDTGFFRNLPQIGEQLWCDFSEKVGHVTKEIL